MTPTTRRRFLSDVSCGMLVAGLGTSLAQDLGFGGAFAEEGGEALPLGEYGPLVDLLESTPAEKLQPILAEKIRRGDVDLKKLIAAGALANAQTFGGCEYVSLSQAMATLPAVELNT